MSLNPTAFRRNTIGLAAVGAFALGSLFPANAQTAVAANPPSSGVSAGQCAAFLHYITDEVRKFPTGHSKRFLGGVLRFNRAGCAPFDKDGEIQIITETDRDAISLGTALTLMGKYDILAVSGVAHCDRPPNGICPTRTGARDAPRARAGKRLAAIDRILAGEKRERVACEASVSPDTLRSWIGTVREKGLSAIISQHDYRARSPDGDLDAAALREWGRTEANPRIARRLQALAYVADGLSVDDAAFRANASDTALRDWILRFRQGGVDALHDREFGRLEQRRELKAFIRRNAQAKHDELCKKVRARFGVRYSPRYVQRLAAEHMKAVALAQMPEIGGLHARTGNEAAAELH